MASYTVSELEGIIVIVLGDTLEMHNTDEFYSDMQQLIEGSTPRMILDFTAVEFVSSLGLAVLIRLHGRLNKKGSDLKLAALPNPIAELLRFTRLDKVFEIHPTVAEARAAFE